jgi:cyclophilin family peptidyl-prolyl cis-trans isomerase
LADPSKANGGELFRIADLLYENENVDQAYQYCQDLLKNKFESVQFDDLVAATAYRVDQFDQAEEFEAKASKTSANTRISNIAVKSDIQQCKKAWEKEKEIRAKEAAANDNPRVKIETEVGDIVVELFENEAPENVANYISLVKSGYYDNTEFYSVILAASIFHGSKNGSNNSSPGYKIYSETDSPNRRFPFRGALTMFMQKKDEGGSIYTMALKPSPHLDGFFQTTFGRIVEGFDVLPKIAKYNMRFSSEFPFCGMEPTKVTKVTVLRDRGHEYAPRKVEAGQPATTPASN